MIDLRSDTVTRPTEGMRRAMAAAEVGDDVYGEDPTAVALEVRAAGLLGKEAALFVPSGVMANQIALLVHCQRGDEVIVGEHAHIPTAETGAGAAWAGVQIAIAGKGGLFTAEEMAACVHAPADWTPRTRLVAIENTHSHAGGRIFPQEEINRIAQKATSLGLAMHLDGARIWNAAVALGSDVATLAGPFSTVSACFSKGLGAPVGSVLAGPRDLIRAARRFRKMMGGGMRQIGVLCAAANYALDHHVQRLAVDHGHARTLADRLLARGLPIDRTTVETNMVSFDVENAEALVRRVREKGVLIGTMSATRVRVVFHLDIAEGDVDVAAEAIASVYDTSR